MAQRLRSVLRMLRNRREGSVAAEFGLIAPIFFTLAMGGIEFGSIAMSINSMQLAANVAAREVAVNRISEAAATARMAPYLPGWMNGDVAVAITESHPTEPRINTVTITLTAPASKAAAISIFTRALSWTIVTQSNVQQEMPFDNAPV